MRTMWEDQEKQSIINAIMRTSKKMNCVSWPWYLKLPELPVTCHCETCTVCDSTDRRPASSPACTHKQHQPAVPSHQHQGCYTNSHASSSVVTPTAGLVHQQSHQQQGCYTNSLTSSSAKSHHQLRYITKYSTMSSTMRSSMAADSQYCWHSLFG